MSTSRSGRKVWLAAAVAAAVFISAVQMTIPGTSMSAAELVLSATRVDGALPIADPESAVWDSATAVEMPLSAQQFVRPNRSLPFVPSLKVQALKNQSWVSFRISWADTTKDNRTTSQTDFRDSVAIQFAPKGSLPNICMGAKDLYLQIAHWKADWQADIEEGFRDLQHEFPNFWVDMYPYAVGAPPYTIPDAFNGTARDYLVGWKVGNPFSQPLKVTAVEDAVAAGFGTIATQAMQNSIGRGVWTGSEWKVVIARPLVTGDNEDVELSRGAIVAFAVWDGTSRDVGARKSVSSWAELAVPGEPSAPRLSPELSLAVYLSLGTAFGLGLFVLAWSSMRQRKERPSRRTGKGGKTESGSGPGVRSKANGSVKNDAGPEDEGDR